MIIPKLYCILIVIFLVSIINVGCKQSTSNNAKKINQYIVYKRIVHGIDNSDLRGKMYPLSALPILLEAKLSDDAPSDVVSVKLLINGREAVDGRAIIEDMGFGVFNIEVIIEDSSGRIDILHDMFYMREFIKIDCAFEVLGMHTLIDGQGTVSSILADVKLTNLGDYGPLTMQPEYATLWVHGENPYSSIPGECQTLRLQNEQSLYEGEEATEGTETRRQTGLILEFANDCGELHESQLPEYFDFSLTGRAQSEDGTVYRISTKSVLVSTADLQVE